MDCTKPALLDNGVCDKELLLDFDCKYDYPDCSEEHLAIEQCYLAEQKSYISCSLALEMYLQYPNCEGIRLCCPQMDKIGNGVCDKSIQDNFHCNYDMPDCKTTHQSNPICPFPELVM